jgi:methionyl-tRNA formyltransferase
MLKKETGIIDWSLDAARVANLIRGVTPWPGAQTMMDDKALKVWKAHTGSGKGSPGRILQTGKIGIEVACGEGSLIIEELQLEGKKRLPARDFLAGYHLAEGIKLGGEKVEV